MWKRAVPEIPDIQEAVGYVEKCIIAKFVGEEAKMIIEVPLKPGGMGAWIHGRYGR